MKGFIMTAKFNIEQLRAINVRDKNVLVSAGAGSGKTTVLANRVLSLLKDGYSLDRMLILTFTNNAALNMKRKIKKLIEKEEQLKDQLGLVDGSDIETFDAFNKKLANKYRVELDLISPYEIASETTFDVIRRNFLHQEFEKLVEQKNKCFMNILDNYTDNSYDPLIKLILKIDKSLELRIDAEDYLESLIINPLVFKFEDVEYELYNYFYSTLKDFKSRLIVLYEREPNDGIERIIALMNDILDHGVDYPSLKSLILDVYNRFPSVRNFSLSNDYKVLKRTFYDKVKANMRTTCSLQEMKAFYKNNSDSLSLIYTLTKNMRNELSKFKDKNHAYSFSDIALKVLKLIKSNSIIREELKTHYQEIMVDEYQDNSDLQEEMINMISNNNLFLVGDVKQSIYRFRNANPKLFMNRYQLYKKDSSLGEVIDMNKNYRSSKNVINHINYLFNDIMTLDFGGADYQKSHNIVCANPIYQDSNFSDRVINLQEHGKDQSDEEYEIELVGKDIKSRVFNEGCSYKDFAIIVDRKTDFSSIISIFSELGIPLTVTYNTDLTSMTFIHILKNLLLIIKYIEAKEYDADFIHPYMSLARSYLVNESDEEIYKRIISKTYLDDEFIKTISLKCHEYKDYPLDIKFIKIIASLNILEKINHDDEFDEDVHQLLLFIDVLKQLTSLKMNVSEACEYFSSLDEEKLEYLVEFKSDAKEAVTLINIHKSKGLEYEHCYFMRLKKNYSENDITNSLQFSKDYGIILPAVFNDVNGEKIKKDLQTSLLFKRLELKEEREERIRLLYVALTRAKKSMTFTRPFIEDDEEKKIRVLENIRSFYDILDHSYFYELLENIEVIDTELHNNKNEITYKDFAFNYHENQIFTTENIPYYKRASKQNIHSSYEVLRLGTQLHEILQVIDFYHPDYSFIKVKRYIELVKDFLSQPFMKDIDKARIFKEHQFIDEENGIMGVIDLLMIYQDRAVIVDYKLKNISDEEYKEQLKFYQAYIERITGKPTQTILYSLLLRQYEITV